MELRVLRYAIKTAELGSMNAAARVLLVSQPSLSRQVRALERELGATIFNVRGNKLAITPYGERFIKAAQILISQSDALKDSSRLWNNPADLSLVCAPQIFDTLIYPASLDRIISLTNIFTRESTYVSHFVREGKADIGLSPMILHDDVKYIKVEDVPLCLQIADSIDSLPIGPLELRDLPSSLICLDSSRETRRVLQQACIDNGVSLNISVEVEMGRTAQLLALTGLKPCIISGYTAPEGLNTHVININGQPLTLPIYGIWQNDHFMEDLIVNVINDLKLYQSSVYLTGTPKRAFE